MYVIKTLEVGERGSFAHLTAKSLRSLLDDAARHEQYLAVGAFAWPCPVGFAFVELGRQEGPLLRSVAVARPYRRQGLGRSLLKAVGQELVDRGFSKVEAQQFTSESASQTELSALLAATGWSAMRVTGLFCESNYDLIAQAPWVRHGTFPPGFETFPWAALSAEERCRTLDTTTESWFPPQLHPCLREEHIHLPTSVGLRHQGKLAGWCITHAVGADGLLVASLFVRAELQARGHAIRLLAYAIRAAANSGRTQLHFNVGVGMTGMLSFYDKHMKAHVTRARLLHQSVTSLPC